jgi:hypothetical protein
MFVPLANMEPDFGSHQRGDHAEKHLISVTSMTLCVIFRFSRVLPFASVTGRCTTPGERVGRSTTARSLTGSILTRLSGLFGPRRTAGLHHNQHIAFFNCARRVLIEREHMAVVDQPDDEHACNRIRRPTRGRKESHARTRAPQTSSTGNGWCGTTTTTRCITVRSVICGYRQSKS